MKDKIIVSEIDRVYKEARKKPGEPEKSKVKVLKTQKNPNDKNS